MKININKLMMLTLAALLGSAAYSQEKMEIEGAIILSNSEDPTPAPGTIRWTGTDFEGWNGQWMSLTSSSGPIGSGMVTDVDGNQYLTVDIALKPGCAKTYAQVIILMVHQYLKKL
ncbi:MAG: hypothetical protein IPL46_03560 [Saprospiraceae bacterium]|nr:hypothetical protein [Saprospiraceae bacterium]